MNINKNKNRNSRKMTLKQKMNQKRRNYTRKMMKRIDQSGGTKQNVCDELPDLKQNNIFNIFKYAIQLPKITK